jgi:hypothetical protein
MRLAVIEVPSAAAKALMFLNHRTGAEGTGFSAKGAKCNSLGATPQVNVPRILGSAEGAK